jgi:hypothetical protein
LGKVQTIESRHVDELTATCGAPPYGRGQETDCREQARDPVTERAADCKGLAVNSATTDRPSALRLKGKLVSRF